MVTNLRAQHFLSATLMLKLVCQLKGGKDHVRLGCDLSISEERMHAPVHHLCQRLDVRFVSIAAHLIRLTSDVDFYRTLHSRGDNIERCGNVKVSCQSDAVLPKLPLCLRLICKISYLNYV